MEKKVLSYKKVIDKAVREILYFQRPKSMATDGVPSFVGTFCILNHYDKNAFRIHSEKFKLLCVLVNDVNHRVSMFLHC